MRITERVRAVIYKETHELVRDPAYLGLALAIPLLLLLLLGYGLNIDIKGLRVLVVDQDGTAQSRGLVDRFVHSEYFELVGVVRDRETADEGLQMSRARIIVDVPAGFARRLARRERASIAVVVDGSHTMRGAVAQGYVEAVVAGYNQELIARQLGVPVDAPLGVAVSTSVWYNPALESKNAIVPGMMVIILMIFPALLGALIVVREKETGTVLNLYTSPVRRWEVIAGKAIPYVALAMIDYLIVLGAARWVFDVRFVGSLGVLTAGALVYSACTVGMGILVSVLTRTQLSAMLITFLVTLTPAMNYAGFLTPIASLDPVGKVISQILPATHFMIIARGCFLKGLGLAAYRASFFALFANAVVLYGASTLLFRKRVT
jgi:ABC-2 type transport system permease protein